MILLLFHLINAHIDRQPIMHLALSNQGRVGGAGVTGEGVGGEGGTAHLLPIDYFITC